MLKISFLGKRSPYNMNTTRTYQLDTIKYISFKSIIGFEIDYHTCMGEINPRYIDITIYQKGEKQFKFKSNLEDAKRYESEILSYHQKCREESGKKIVKAINKLTNAIQFSPPTDALPTGGAEYQKTKADFEDTVASQDEK